jgi:3-dehydroquinate synthase
MPTQNLTVELDSRSYPIYIGSGLLADAGLLSRHLGSGAVAVITNATVAPLYLGRLQAALGARVTMVKVLPDGEQHKNLEMLSGIYDALLESRCDRQVTVVALGGGVVGDIAGFAAATYQRGVRFVQVPTTLLAQVDSSVGGKTAVNHPRGKNMIGAFHQPHCVIADTDTLATLPAREYAAGLAEVVKYGLIGDREFYAWLHAERRGLAGRAPAVLVEAILRSCANKAKVVAADERESEGGVRALLNFGHTLGHAVETATAYRDYLHGEAVAIGMLMAAEFSRRLGFISGAEVADLRELLLAFGLPVDPPAVASERMLELMRGDKKAASGRIRLVLLRGIGDALLSSDFPDEALRRLLADAAHGVGVPA